MEHETGAGGVPVSMLTHARGDRESLSWALFAAPFLPGDARHCGRRTSRRVSHVLDLPHNDVLAAERFGPGPMPCCGSSAPAGAYALSVGSDPREAL